jgi:hypothetical protein
MKHPFYPFPLSLLPVSLLLMGNLVQLSGTRLLAPALAMLILTGIFMLCSWFLWWNWNWSAWIAVAFLAVLNYQVLIWVAIPIAAVLFLWKAPSEKKNICFNVAALLLLAWPLGMIAVKTGQRIQPAVGANHDSPLPNKPDIYFIVLDSYTSHAVLQERFGYDNTPFLQALQAQGFTTGDCSSSYDHTAFSLSATLNQGQAGTDWVQLWPELQHNQVMDALKAQGYRTVAFETGYDWSEIRTADEFISGPPGLSDFDAFYLSQTLAGAIPAVRRQIMDGWSEHYRLRLLNALQALPNVANQRWPKFVFLHLLAPHPPFVFHADGSKAGGYSLRNPDWVPDSLKPLEQEYLPEVYAKGYIDEMGYIDRVLPGVLGQVLKASASPPLIIVQGDHGAWYAQGWQQYAILCAVHDPPGWSVPLEPEQTFDFVFGG